MVEDDSNETWNIEEFMFTMEVISSEEYSGEESTDDSSIDVSESIDGVILRKLEEVDIAELEKDSADKTGTELEKLSDGKNSDDESNIAGDENIIEDEEEGGNIIVEESDDERVRDESNIEELDNFEEDGKALEIDEFCKELEGFEVEKLVEESEDDEDSELDLEGFRVVEVSEELWVTFIVVEVKKVVVVVVSVGLVTGVVVVVVVSVGLVTGVVVVVTAGFEVCIFPSSLGLYFASLQQQKPPKGPLIKLR